MKKEKLKYLPVHMIIENHEIGFDNQNKKFDLIIVNNQQIEIKSNNITNKLRYDEINRIELSLCSIMENYTISYVWMTYHIFVTIYDKNGNVYPLECENDDVLTKFFQILHDKNIKVIDVLDLEENYLRFPNKVERNKYFERIMPKKAKENKIKYPTKIYMGKLGNSE